MAVVLIFRVAVALTPFIARWCFSSGCDAQQVANAIAREYDKLIDPDVPASELSESMTAAAGAVEGGFIAVTDFPAPFELRRLQWRLSRAPASRIEDVDVMTFHFIKATGGTPGTWNDTTDSAAVETAMNTFTNTLIGNWHAFIHSDQYRWYKDGPAFYHEEAGKPVFQPNGDNPAVRITEVDRAGTAAGANALPPQCAVSFTEITSQRKHWGRFYLPLSAATLLDGTGLLGGGSLTSLRDAAVTAYNACRAASCIPVVFSNAKPARPNARGGTLPAAPAIAYEVSAIQMDDIVDIIRSRRWSAGVNKSRVSLT